MEVIPAIDLLGGRPVRLRQGRYDEVTTYPEPLEDLARGFRRDAARLHVVDLEGARDGAPRQEDAIQRIVAAFGGGVQVGGGLRTAEAAESRLAAGVSRVVLGTAALRDPALLERLAFAHPGRVVVAVDAREGRVATDGWLDVSETQAVDLVRRVGRLPIAAVLYTDILRDGMETGPNVVETARLADETGVPVIASGGVGTLEHLGALARASRGIVAAIVGRALHERRFTLADAVAAAR